MGWFTGRDHNDKKTEERRQRNRDILAPLGDGDASARFYARRAEQRVEQARLENVYLRQLKSGRERARTLVQLEIDSWIFQNGPVDTRERYEAMCGDIEERVLQKLAAEKQLRDRAGYQSNLGAIGHGMNLEVDVYDDPEGIAAFEVGERATTQATIEHFKAVQQWEREQAAKINTNEIKEPK
jgi:hypothetical protein